MRTKVSEEITLQQWKQDPAFQRIFGTSLLLDADVLPVRKIIAQALGIERALIMSAFHQQILLREQAGLDAWIIVKPEESLPEGMWLWDPATNRLHFNWLATGLLEARGHTPRQLQGKYADQYTINYGYALYYIQRELKARQPDPVEAPITRQGVP